MNLKYISIILIILIVIVLTGAAGAYFLYKPLPQQQKPNQNPTACTMEAKLCPDDSYVGRVGPNCEFAPCPTVEKSGIKGLILLGPTCPVERIPPDPKCADKPYKTNLITTSIDGTQTSKQFSSDTNGNFSVDLLPGEYSISSLNTVNIYPRCSSQENVKVEKEQYTTITLHCDTGIR